MKNGSLKKVRAAEIAALLLSAVIIIAVCVLPTMLVGRLSSELYPMIGSARERVFAGEPERALSTLETVRSSIEARTDLLMIFYGHDDVMRLLSAAKAASDLAKAQDRQQLLDELAELEYGLRLLDEINGAAARDVF